MRIGPTDSQRYVATCSRRMVR